MASPAEDIRTVAIVTAILMLSEYLASNTRGYSFDQADADKHADEAWRVFAAVQKRAP